MTQGPCVCERCGSTVHEGDKFCGICGARVPLDAREAVLDEEDPTQVLSSQGSPGRGRNRERGLAVAAGALLVLLMGTGAVAYAALGPDTGLLGWPGPQPSDKEGIAPTQEEGLKAEETPPTEHETTREAASTPASASPDAPPDPAFDKILPTLVQRTRVSIMLPAELPDRLKNVAVDKDFKGNGYSILFLREPPNAVEEGYVRAKVLGTLRVLPEDESRSSEYFEAAEVETVVLPDGTEATLRYMEPVREKGGNSSPYREGRFDKGGVTYALTITSDDVPKRAVKRALSSMVYVPQGDASGKARTTPRTARDGPPKETPKP